MSVSRHHLINIWWLFLAFLLLEPPSFAEMKISENQLPADTIVEDVFQGGRGLPLGKIQAVRGEVIVYHQEPTVGYRVKAGLPLYDGDTIKTRINGRILCRLIDGTIFSLVPETTLTILKCNYNSGRKESEAFLSLTHGDGRFQVKARAGVFFNEFKLQTHTAFAQVQSADFIIRASLNMTEIISFDRSRLEVTNLAEPETSFFVTDYQRVFVQNQLDLQSGPQMVETVTQDEAEEMIAKTRLLPQNYLFASSPEKHSVREEDTTAEGLKSGSSYDEFYEIFNPDQTEMNIDD